MGACDFSVRAKRNGETLNEAFLRTVQEARRENGYGGYSGTIAEKHVCKPVELSVKITTWAEAEAEAARLMRDTEKYSDKWGPCWSIHVPGADGGWVFFGVAPS